MSESAIMPPRHAQLFELLRQSNLSARTDLRLRIETNRRRNCGGEANLADHVLQLAQKSWGAPEAVARG